MGDSHREIVFDTTGDTPVVTVSADDATITVTDDVGGGTGGLMEAWQTAEDLKTELDSFVAAFGGAFNDQHALGFDQNGNAGGEFFTFSVTDPAAGFSVNAALLADDSLLALADDPSAEVGDRGNLDALSALQNAEIVAGETPEDFMAGLYAQLGDTVRRAEVHYITETGALEDAEALRESISGVDLDEEAASLLEWQAAYQAAARVVTTSNELLNELMNIVR
jgi:flagellar hook-associated protein 1 FlgK